MLAKLRGKALALLTAALLVIGGGLTASVAQDNTDPVTTALLPNDMITVIRNGHQRLAAPLYLTQVGSLDQVGTCTMAAGTTCTVTLTNVYTAIPLCQAQDKSGFIASHAVGTAGSAVVTLTAASSQSDVFNVSCNPNPN